MERKLQEHHQELEALREEWKMKKEKMQHEDQLKLEAADVREKKEMTTFVILADFSAPSLVDSVFLHHFFSSSSVHFYILYFLPFLSCPIPFVSHSFILFFFIHSVFATIFISSPLPFLFLPFSSSLYSPPL